MQIRTMGLWNRKHKRKRRSRSTRSGVRANELGIHINWYEETDKGIYERITVNVETEQGEMEVITYRCIEEEAHYIQPCEKYINQIIDSAKYHGLPVEYLESLEIFRE